MIQGCGTVEHTGGLGIHHSMFCIDVEVCGHFVWSNTWNGVFQGHRCARPCRSPGSYGPVEHTGGLGIHHSMFCIDVEVCGHFVWSNTWNPVVRDQKHAKHGMVYSKAT